MNTQISFDAAVSASVKQAQINITRNLPLKDSLYTSENMPASAQADKADRRENKAGLFYSLRRVSVIAVTVFFFAFSPVLTVHAVRDAISDTVIAWYDKYISVESTADSYLTQIKDFECGYIPDKFQFVSSTEYNSGVIKEYFSEDGYLKIYIKRDDGTNLLGIDNEHTTFYGIEINGLNGFWTAYEDGSNMLILTGDGNYYKLDGYTAVNELVKIFVNLKNIL